jgi:porphobilinogen synthase
MSAFPVTRLRRLRSTGALRSLVRETRLDLEDFVMPLFAGPSTVRNEELPGMSRYSVDDLVAEAGQLAGLGVKALLLFGVPDEKDDEGSGAWDEEGIVQRALRAVRAEQPGLLLITDVCRCEYTSHGHCGLLTDAGEVDNDATITRYASIATSHADAGADVIAPSGMMDGQVAAIRTALDGSGHDDAAILAYAAKYASVFYGPFRDAAECAPQFGDRRGYQMDPPNAREALDETALDVAEGADMVMVKPALPYLDIVRALRDSFDVPVAAYHVSGEYAMLKAAAANGWLDGDAAALESLTSIKRAGADFVLTYFARELAERLS